MEKERNMWESMFCSERVMGGERIKIVQFSVGDENWWDGEKRKEEVRGEKENRESVFKLSI